MTKFQYYQVLAEMTEKGVVSPYTCVTIGRVACRDNALRIRLIDELQTLAGDYDPSNSWWDPFDPARTLFLLSCAELFRYDRKDYPELDKFQECLDGYYLLQSGDGPLQP